MNQLMIETNPQWKPFYKAAGAMAVSIVIAGLVDTGTSMLGPGAQDNGAIEIARWFTLFQTNRFYAFSNLGLINIITLTLGIPIYIGLAIAFRLEQPAIVGLAAGLFFMGTAVYLSSNTVFPLFALSEGYARAAESQKPMLEAAGQALLAGGADLTPGTFMGFFLTQSAGLLIASVMLRSGVFGKWTALAGLAGFGLTSVFFVLAAFAPEHYDMAMVLAMSGGPLLLIYQLLLARRFFQLGRRKEEFDDEH